MSTEPKWGVNLVGPFSQTFHHAVVDGFRVPHIIVYKGEAHNDGKVRVLMDGRFIYEFDDNEQFKQSIHMLAQGMAVAAGYSCFGEHSVKDPNPFKVRMTQIDEPEETK